MSISAVEPGRYMVVRTPGFLAWVIRMATRSAYNHAFLVTGHNEIIEADLSGVRVSPLSRYAGCKAAANAAEPMTSRQCVLTIAAAQIMVGDVYNYPDLLAIGLGDLHWHWKALIKFCAADKAFICSQLVAIAGKAGGLDWMCATTDVSGDQVTPAALAKRPGVVPVTI